MVDLWWICSKFVVDLWWISLIDLSNLWWFTCGEFQITCSEICSEIYCKIYSELHTVSKKTVPQKVKFHLQAKLQLREQR